MRQGLKKIACCTLAVAACMIGTQGFAAKKKASKARAPKVAFCDQESWLLKNTSAKSKGAIAPMPASWSSSIKKIAACPAVVNSPEGCVKVEGTFTETKLTATQMSRLGVSDLASGQQALAADRASKVEARFAQVSSSVKVMDIPTSGSPSTFRGAEVTFDPKCVPSNDAARAKAEADRLAAAAALASKGDALKQAQAQLDAANKAVADAKTENQRLVAEQAQRVAAEKLAAEKARIEAEKKAAVDAAVSAERAKQAAQQAEIDRMKKAEAERLAAANAHRRDPRAEPDVFLDVSAMADYVVPNYPHSEKPWATKLGAAIGVGGRYASLRVGADFTSPRFDKDYVNTDLKAVLSVRPWERFDIGLLGGYTVDFPGKISDKDMGIKSGDRLFAGVEANVRVLDIGDESTLMVRADWIPFRSYEHKRFSINSSNTFDLGLALRFGMF